MTGMWTGVTHRAFLETKTTLTWEAHAAGVRFSACLAADRRAAGQHTLAACAPQLHFSESRDLSARFVSAVAEVAIAVVVEADALLAHVPEQFEAAFGQHGLARNVEAGFRRRLLEKRRHSIGRGSVRMPDRLTAKCGSWA